MHPDTPSIFDAPIVVVEDSDEDFETLCEVAIASGVTRTIYRAASGDACMAMLRGVGNVHLPMLPALILTDLNSHGVEGRDAIVAIKTEPGLRGIPLVVLTTSANPKDVAFCYQAGANAYHVKPLRHDHYLLLLRAVMDYWLVSVTLPVAVAKGD